LVEGKIVAAVLLPHEAE